MSSKAYSKEQREEIRARLLVVALEQYSKYGIRAVHLMDILDVVGISKPFFYKFFGSVQEFVIAVLNFQWTFLDAILDEADQQEGWREMVTFVLTRFVNHRKYGLLVMTQEEEVWVRSRVNDELYDSFMATQISYFEELLRRWKIPAEACPPKILANMVITVIVTNNSASRALPFLYLDELERTAQAQIEGLVGYLETLRDEHFL